MLVIFIMLCITSLGLIYLKTGSFYLFLSFKSLSLTFPLSGNHKSDLFFEVQFFIIFVV